jgi:indoleamine 2,3-dioxygenase
MSPHTVDSEILGQRESWDLSKFAVSKNAFLPETSPPKMLSDPYYESWELIAHNLQELIETRRVHDAIRELPVLSTDFLKSEAEWRRAYVILAFFTHAYVWGGEKAEEVRLPIIYITMIRLGLMLTSFADSSTCSRRSVPPCFGPP